MKKIMAAGIRRVLDRRPAEFATQTAESTEADTQAAQGTRSETMDTMTLPAVRAVMEIDGLASELHDLIRKVRRHLVDPAYRLTPSEVAQTEQRIAELGGRQGWLRYKRLADGQKGSNA
jgi:hypothetical protein